MLSTSSSNNSGGATACCTQELRSQGSPLQTQVPLLGEDKPRLPCLIDPSASSAQGHRFTKKPVRYDMVPTFDIACDFPVVAPLRGHQRATTQNHKIYGIPSRDTQAPAPLLPLNHSPRLPTFSLLEMCDINKISATSVDLEAHCRTSHLAPLRTSCNFVENLTRDLLPPNQAGFWSADQLARLSGKEAQILLNGLQKWLDTELHSPYRRKILRLLVDIATTSNELPQSLFVNGVIMGRRDPHGLGGFADVFYGIYHKQPVAIKRLRTDESGSSKSSLNREFCKEALVWRQLKHPSILPFVGVDGETFKDTQSLAMISPWMERGTIMEYIRSKDYNARVSRHRLMTEIAEGLRYLHEQGIAHGDLHGRNVLVTQDGRPCLTDFGLSVVGDLSRSRRPTTIGAAGVNRWLAPETYLPDPVLSRKTLAGDVFSYGRMCLAICTTRAPFAGIPDRGIYYLILTGVCPPRPSEAQCDGYAMPDTLWKLVNDCWAIDPRERPTIVTVIATLLILAKG